MWWRVYLRQRSSLASTVAALRELSVSGRDEKTGAQEQQQERHLFLQTGPV